MGSPFFRSTSFVTCSFSGISSPTSPLPNSLPFGKGKLNSKYVAVASRRAQVTAITGRETTIDSNRAHNALSSDFASVKTMEHFWKFADESKLNAQYLADRKIAFLLEASADEVRSICMQYRYFVERYPDNLASLIRKMPNNQLKSQLAMILSEELGSGEIDGSHIVWYDRFLRSIGVRDEQLQSSMYKENEELLLETERRCNTESCEHVIGLVGMGGECLCQIYLTVMHKYLVQNEYIKSLGNTVDWLFWNFHIGEEDIAHRVMVRRTISEIITDQEDVRRLAEGYQYGKKAWDQFWENNYKETRAAAMY